MKKFATFLLFAALIASLFAFSAFGENAPATLSVENVTVQSGIESVEAEISIANNPGIASIGVEISFGEGLTLVGAENGAAFSEFSLIPPKQLKTGGVTGNCRFAWSGTDNITDDGVILKLTFELDTSIKDRKIKIEITEIDAANEKREPVYLEAVKGFVKIINYKPGDVDGNGIVNMLDVMTLCRYYVDGCKYDPFGYAIRINENAGDVNGSGYINMMDVLMLCQYYVDDCQYDPNGYAVIVVPGNMDCTHEYTRHISAYDAGCVTAGNIEYWYCTNCGKHFKDETLEDEISRESVLIPATGHEEVVLEAVDATCEAQGLTEGKYCAACHVVFTEQKTLPALGHNYEVSSTSDATCEDPSYIVYKCSRCGDEYSAENGIALGHDFTNVEAVEKSLGNCEYVLTYACKNCSEVIDGEHFFRHSYAASITKAATCAEDGVKTLTCSVCGNETTEIIEKNPTGHSWTESAVNNGERTDVCSLCQATKTVIAYEGNSSSATNAANLADKEIALADASIKLDKDVTDAIGDKDITVSVDTLTDDVKQSLVGKDELEQIGDNPIYDFTINDGEDNISNLGGYVTITLPYTLEEGEDIDSIAVWYITESGELESIAATYNNGFVTFETNHFSYYTVTRLTPAQRCALYGHNYATQHVDGKCKNESYDYSVCIRCHDAKKENVVAPTEHDFAVSEEKTATCEESGYEKYTCKNCGESYKVETPAIGHDWYLDESAESTCAEEGFELYVCGNCEEEYRITFEKLAHEYTEIVVDPTETEAGYTLHQCKNCTYNYKSDFVPPISTTCNHVDLTEVRYELPEGTCGGSISYYTCSCGKVKLLNNSSSDNNVLCQFNNSATTYYFDENGIEHQSIAGVCKKCGLTINGDAFRPDDSCNEYGYRESYDVIFQGVVLLSVSYESCHNYSYTYELLVEDGTCDDGWIITTVCNYCGKMLRYSGKGHLEDYESIDLKDYGFCGGYISVTKCPFCGEIFEFNSVSDDSCYWDYVDTTDDGFEEYYCENCGTTKFVKVIEGEKDENCEHTVECFYKYSRGGEELFSFERSYIEYDHNIGRIFEFPEGGTCEDGYIVTEVCLDCGMNFGSWEYKGHWTEREEIDLAEEYGLCEGWIYEDYCLACGAEFGKKISTFCDWNYVGETNDGFDEYYCENCGTTRIVAILKSEKNENCEYTVTETYKFFRDGKELFTFEYDSDTRTEHNIGRTYKLPEGGTCVDEYKIFEACLDCGKEFKYLYNSSGHRTYAAEKIDLAEEYGLCGGTIRAHRCEICNNIIRFDWDLSYCRWNSRGINGDGFDEHYCLSCGTTWLERATKSDKDENCIYTETNTFRFIRDGAELYSIESVNTYKKHNLEYDVLEKLGATCDDGVKFKETCKDCGYTRTIIVRGHYTVDTNVDLGTDYGLCGGYIYKNRCIACGEIMRFEKDDWYCNWQKIGRTDNGFFEYYCDICRTTRLTKTLVGEKDVDNYCRFEQTDILIYLRDGEELYNNECVWTNANHSYEFTSVEFVNGVDCEGGYRCTRTCKDCGATSNGSGSGHGMWNMETIYLSRFGACSGIIDFISCPCGMYKDVWCGDLCTDTYTSNRYVDEEGKTIYVETRTCEDCDLRYSKSYYDGEKVPGNCLVTRYNTMTVTVGNTLVCEWDYTDTSTEHDYVISEYVLHGKTCEDGVDAVYKCTNCNKSYSDYYEWHTECIVEETIDLSALGCVCGGKATVYRCACGEYYSVDLDCFCEFEKTPCEPWIESNFSQEYSYASDVNGNWGNSYGSSAWIYICAVTDPACAFRIRYCNHWVKEDENSCLLRRYQTWQFGYNEEDGTCLYETTIPTSEIRFCHTYEETVIDDNHRSYVCSICGSSSTYAREETVDENGIRVTTEIRTAYNPNNDGRNKSFKCVYTYTYDQKNYRSLTSSESFLYEDANGKFQLYEYEDTYFYLTTYEGNDYSTNYETYHFNGNNGIKDPATGKINYGYWYQRECDYSFGEGECKRIVTRTGSDYYKPEVYEESACSTRTEWITEKARTCTQDGVATAYTTCYICGTKKNPETVYFAARGHRWSKLDNGIYYCVFCGMESANGANGSVSFEDLTDYEDGENYVVGYCANTGVRFDKYILLVLPTGEEVIVDSVDIVKIDEPRAFAINKQAVAEFAKANGYEDYLVKLAFVPQGDDGSLDYAIVFEKTERKVGVFSSSVSFVDYLYNGETAYYTIVPEEDAVWTFRSTYSDYYDIYGYYHYRPYASLYDSEGNKLAVNAWYESYNNYKIVCELKAGETYTLEIRWNDNINGYSVNNCYLPLTFEVEPLNSNDLEPDVNH